jgi:hypothetical protein
MSAKFGKEVGKPNMNKSIPIQFLSDAAREVQS